MDEQVPLKKQIVYVDDPYVVAEETRCVVYARYSTDQQSSDSSADQIAEVKSAVRYNHVSSRLFPGSKLKIVAEFSDDGVSGGSMVGRDGLQEVIALIQTRRVKVVLVANFQRLLRGMGAALFLYNLLQEYGAELISISDAFSSAEEGARIKFLGNAYRSEEFLEQISKDTARGLDRRRKHGFSDGHLYFGIGTRATRHCYKRGYQTGSHCEYFIVDHLAEVVRRIFQLAADGFSLQEIARKLNTENHIIPPPAHWDKEGVKRIKPHRSIEWRDRTIFSLLNNKSYLGVFERKKTKIVKDAQGNRKAVPVPKSKWLVIEMPELQIVPQELWDAVRARFKDYNTRKIAAGADARPFKNDGFIRHNCTGLFRCGDCGDAIVTVSGRRGGYYGCQRAARIRSCLNHKMISHKKLEGPFFTWLMDTLVSGEFCRDVAEQYNELRRSRSTNENYDLAGKQTRLAEVTNTLANILRAVEQGAASSTLLARLGELEREKESLEHHVKALKSIDPSMVLMTPAAIRAKMTALDLPKLLQAAEPFEIQRALKPLFAGANVRLERRDKADRGPKPKGAHTMAYWLVGDVDLGRLLRIQSHGMLSTPERVTNRVKLELRLD